MDFAIFRRKFDEILPEFHRNGQEMTKCLEILRKSARKIRKMPEMSGICEKFHSSFHSSFHFFNPLLSGGTPGESTCIAVGEGRQVPHGHGPQQQELDDGAGDGPLHGG